MRSLNMKILCIMANILNAGHLIIQHRGWQITPHQLTLTDSLFLCGLWAQDGFSVFEWLKKIKRGMIICDT